MSNITLDLVLADKIKDFIKDNSLKDHDRLPPTRELANKYHVQRITVTEALKRLVNEGILYSVERKGYFVAEGKIEIDLTKADPFAQFKNSVIGIGKVDTGSEIKRNYTMGEETIAFEISYIPEKIFEKLGKEILEHKPLYPLILNKYGQNNITSNSLLSIPTKEHLDDVVASYLGNGSLILLTQKIMDIDNVTLVHSMFTIRGDRCTLKNTLNREVVK